MNVSKQLRERLHALTSRKFIAAMTSLASAHWLVVYGHIADGVYSAVVIATVAAYIVGNVAQKVATPGTKSNVD